MAGSWGLLGELHACAHCWLSPAGRKGSLRRLILIAHKLLVRSMKEKEDEALTTAQKHHLAMETGPTTRWFLHAPNPESNPPPFQPRPLLPPAVDVHGHHCHAAFDRNT